MNGNTETVKASSTMLKEFLARDKKEDDTYQNSRNSASARVIAVP